MDEILTDEQKTTLKNLLGKPFDTSQLNQNRGRQGREGRQGRQGRGQQGQQ